MKLPLTHSPCLQSPLPVYFVGICHVSLFAGCDVARFSCFDAASQIVVVFVVVPGYCCCCCCCRCCTLANSCRTTAIRLFNSFAALPWLSAAVGVVVCRRHFLLRPRQTNQRVASVRNSSQFAVPRADSSPTASETLATPPPPTHPTLSLPPSTHLSLWHLQNLTLHFAHNSQQQQRQQQ